MREDSKGQQSYLISPEGEPTRILGTARDLAAAFDIARQHAGVPITITGTNWVHHRGRRSRKVWIVLNDGTNAVRQEWT